MLVQNKKIAIIGGGPGGLTLAKLLQLQNVDVKVYERDLNRNARVQGSPLDLHETSGLLALEKASLLEEFKKNFLIGADKLTIVNEKAQVFYSDHDIKQEENFGYEHFRPEIDRGVLREMLIDSLQENTILWDKHFVEMQPYNKGWLMYFKNNETAYADIVIAADGSNSKLRPYLTPITSFYSGITMLEGCVSNAVQKLPIISSLLRGGKIMVFGEGKNILMGQKANGEIGFYFSFKAEKNWAITSKIDFTSKEQVLDWFKHYYYEWDSVWHELIQNVEIPLIPRLIQCMPLDQSWESVPNLTMIGHAAHVMPPFAGEGVNMAMLDALELSECLTTDKFSTISEAILNFENSMRKRASIIAQESLDNGEKMHHKNALSHMLSFFANFK